MWQSSGNDVLQNIGITATDSYVELVHEGNSTRGPLQVPTFKLVHKSKDIISLQPRAGGSNQFWCSHSMLTNLVSLIFATILSGSIHYPFLDPWGTLLGGSVFSLSHRHRPISVILPAVHLHFFPTVCLYNPIPGIRYFNPIHQVLPGPTFGPGFSPQHSPCWIVSD